MRDFICAPGTAQYASRSSATSMSFVCRKCINGFRRALIIALQNKDFGVGRQSLAVKRRKRIPALRKKLSGHLMPPFFRTWPSEGWAGGYETTIVYSSAPSKPHCRRFTEKSLGSGFEFVYGDRESTRTDFSHRIGEPNLHETQSNDCKKLNYQMQETLNDRFLLRWH